MTGTTRSLFPLSPKPAALQHSETTPLFISYPNTHYHHPISHHSSFEPHPKDTTTNNMSQTHNLHASATRQPQDMPRRQGWNTNDILCMGNDYTYADAVKEIRYLWNEWANSVELILHGLIDQMERLHISYTDYLNLVRQLASYPARPASESQHISDSLLSGVWNEWADVVQSVYEEMERVSERSIPLPPCEEQMLYVDEYVDLSKQNLPPAMYMAAHLRKMLRERTDARDELADFMGILSV